MIDSEARVRQGVGQGASAPGPSPPYSDIVKYVLAILLPPLGLLSVGRGGQALVCLILWITIIGWPLAALWALLVVNSAETERRVRRAMHEERDR